MGNLGVWIGVGLVTVLMGGWMLSLETDLTDFVGWGLVAVGGLAAQVGIIAVGVFLAMQERDRAEA